jgi:TPR repeat protein
MAATRPKISIIAALSFFALAMYSGAANAQSADAVLCDRLAAYPSDPDKPPDIKGVISIAPGDIATAIKFCKQAKGSRRFVFQLGRAYEADGKTQDAIAAYRKAANQGSTSALASLAALDKTSGGAQSGETRKMFERAAEAGDPVALSNMAMAYATGDGVPLDYVKARGLFSQAADAGNADAMFQLGLMTEQGDGGPRDDAAARALYEKAAARDHIGALERAGDFNLAGRGGPANESAAKAYYEKAAALGSEDAKSALNRMKCKFTIKDKSGKKVTDLCF